MNNIEHKHQLKNLHLSKKI